MMVILKMGMVVQVHAPNNQAGSAVEAPPINLVSARNMCQTLSNFPLKEQLTLADKLYSV